MSGRVDYTGVFRFDWKIAANDTEYSPTPCSTGTPAFIVYDESFTEAIGSSPKLTLIEARADKFAHEAGVYIQRADMNYFASNYQSGKSTEIYSVDSRTYQVQEHHFEHVTNGNGGCCYDDKILFCCQGGLTTPSALVLVDPITTHSKTLLNNFHGRPFNSVNDVVVHHPKNDIWFTDPTYGFEQAFRPPPQLPSQIYRFEPQSGRLFGVADGFEQCNGLCFSPDYKKMYVTDTGAVQAHGTPGSGQSLSLNPRLPSTIYEYDVVCDGTRLSGRRVFAFCSSGVPDGIKCDGNGNVYAGCGDGIHTWNPAGSLIGKIYVAGVVANFNFARGGIWILAEERLFFAAHATFTTHTMTPQITGKTKVAWRGMANDYHGQRSEDDRVETRREIIENQVSIIAQTERLDFSSAHGEKSDELTTQTYRCGTS